MSIHIHNISIAFLNREGNHFALGCTYKGARYHIWVNPEFQITGEQVLYKNPTARYKQPGYFYTRHLSVDSKSSAAIIAAMIDWAKKTDMLATALAVQAEEEEAAQKVRDAEALEHSKQLLGPKMFDLLVRVQDCTAFGNVFPELRADINAAVDSILKVQS